MYVRTIHNLTIDWDDRLAFREYLDPGDLGRLAGFWHACCLAVFSYLGVEIIGVAAEETERQRETIPFAARRVAYRTILYHVGPILALGLNVYSNDPILASYSTQGYESPFALMFDRAGISGLAHFVKGVTILALVATANTRLYLSVYSLGGSG